MKILLVEDEKELSKSITEYIANDNCIIDYAFNYADSEVNLAKEIKIVVEIYDAFISKKNISIKLRLMKKL